MIRPATTRDAGWCTRLERGVFGLEAWSADTVSATIETDTVLVSEPDGYAVVGDAGSVVDLQRIAVTAGSRRRGLASALLSVALEKAAERGARRMLLEVSAANTDALAFYTAMSFTEIARRRRYYRDGSDAVVMERQVSR